jgi:hypothetical protein
MYDAKLRKSLIRAWCASPSAAGRTQPWSPNIFFRQRSHSATTRHWTLGFRRFAALSNQVDCYFRRCEIHEPLFFESVNVK